MEGKKLEKVTEEKDLGVMISSNFKVSKQCIKAAKNNNNIRFIRIEYDRLHILI